MFKQVEESLKLLKRDKKSIQRSLSKEIDNEAKLEMINHYKIFNQKENILKTLLKQTYSLKKSIKKEKHSSLMIYKKYVRKGN